ncbi:putative glutathione synthase, partial [Ancylostoma duodenale]
TKEHKDRSDVCQTAPFALLPTPFPRKLFEQAVKVQNVSWSCSQAFLRHYAKDVGLAQRKTLAIQRSDYMCHKDQFSCEYTLKQIEVNNIASSMGAHAERVTKMHRRTMTELGYDKETIEKAIPKNEPIKLIAEALYKAWYSFRELYSCSSAVILVIVEDQNQNQIDQKHVEYALEDLGVPVDQIVRRTLTECEQCLTLSPERHLLLSGSRVAVVYFRAGYTPDNYPTEKEWASRLLIERSDAIKSPWIGLQVANTKKTQQVLPLFANTKSYEMFLLICPPYSVSHAKIKVLAEDGVVERFVGHPRDAAAIRSTFAGLWAINGDDPVTQKLIKNYLVRAMQPVELSNVVSELGVYGYALGDRGMPEVRQGGHLLRTKGEKVDEVSRWDSL